MFLPKIWSLAPSYKAVCELQRLCNPATPAKVDLLSLSLWLNPKHYTLSNSLTALVAILGLTFFFPFLLHTWTAAPTSCSHEAASL